MAKRSERTERKGLEDGEAAESNYFELSRSLSAGLLLILPLAVCYEFGVVALRSDINAAAVWIKKSISWLEHPTRLLGIDATLLVNFALLALVIVAVWRLSRKKALNGWMFAVMMGEATVYSLLLGSLASLPLTGHAEFPSLHFDAARVPMAMVIASGAGLYEELLFRLILMGSIFYLAIEIWKLRPVLAGTLALVVSGALFSVVHFGSGEPPEMGAFMFRLVAGIALGVIYLTRGLGIAAWTHALYDFWLLAS